jgi:hypothetical protein
MRRLPLIHGFLLVLMCAVGCTGSSGAPELIPVSGTVMYKGAPVEGAMVNFHHDKAPRISSGVTDKEGKFVLTMLESEDGAMPGTNIITVTKGAAPAAAPAATSNAAPSPEDLAKKMADFKAANDPKKKKEAAGELPAKYGSQTTTPLKEEISATNNKVVLQLAD